MKTLYIINSSLKNKKTSRRTHMKSRIRPAALLALMLLATALSLAGCASFGKGQSSKIVATLQSVKDDYNQAELQAEITEGALNELNVSADVDLKQAYDTFSESVDRMQAAGKPLIIHADAMYFRGESYFVESVKSGTACVYPRQIEPGDKQAAELGAYFNAISEEGWEVKRAFRAYQFDISQIQDYLSRNLTPKGIETITPIIDKAKVDGDSLKESLEQALAAVERAKTAKVQAAPKGS
jgi:hypothetical protein